MACSTPSAIEPSSTPAPPAPTATDESPVIATFTPTPTEVGIPENRVEPISVEDLYGPNANFEEFIEESRGGGYFQGIPQAEEADQSIWLDFSHEGKAMVVEAEELDPYSWGVYFPRVSFLHSNPNVIWPSRGILSTIGWMMFSRGVDFDVEWGSLREGTGLFYSYDDLLLQYVDREYGLSREELLKKVLPYEDDRFVCVQTSLSSQDGSVVDRRFSGVLCTKK